MLDHAGNPLGSMSQILQIIDRKGNIPALQDLHHPVEIDHLRTRPIYEMLSTPLCPLHLFTTTTSSPLSPRTDPRITVDHLDPRLPLRNAVKDLYGTY